MRHDQSIEEADYRVARRLGPLFFVSGVAALAYQICWQRLLFTVFGVDIDSITIIVSVFMLGLGTGALLGGILADHWPKLTLILFALAECGIGLFGWLSPDLIRGAGELFVDVPAWGVAVVTFTLLLFPTALMGATLPLLVAHVTRLWGHVGKSIGMLYQVNTAGAATGVAIVGLAWFLLFDLDTAIRTAAVLNVLVSILTLAWVKRRG